MRGRLARICVKCMRNVSEAAAALLLESLISSVGTWCWNRTSIKQMRRNIGRLSKMIKLFNFNRKAPDRSNSTVNQLLSQLEDHASQGIELLDGEPTASQVQDAMTKFEQIRIIAQDLKELRKKNCGESKNQLIKAPTQVLKIKPPQFKPRYLHRRTRFQVLMNRNVSVL